MAENESAPDEKSQPASIPADSDTSPYFPFATTADCLRFIGDLRSDVAINEEVNIPDLWWWVSVEIQSLTGLAVNDIQKAIHRLANNTPLDGYPRNPSLGVYGEGQDDLLHVAVQLRQLDRDDGMSVIWRKLCKKWPIFAKAQAKAFPMKHIDLTSAAAPTAEIDCRDNHPPTLRDIFSILPGAFVYRGYRQPLQGLPLRVLEQLIMAPGRTVTMAGLQRTVWKDREAGQEAVRSAVATLREALREAMKVVHVMAPDDPLPCVDRGGADTTAWRLDLPN